MVRRADRGLSTSTGNAFSSESKPFAWIKRSSPNDTDRMVSCLVVSPARTSPGAAATWIRAAAFTTGPVTSSWPVGPVPVADRKARADRADGVVLVDLGKAEHRHDRVADELLGLAAQGHQLLGRGVV